MLDTNLTIRCPWCNKSSTLGAWDTVTFGKCSTREMKRAFRSLTKEGTWLKNSNKYFMCPDCNRWLKASQLILVTDDKALKKFGGEPVIISAFSGNKRVDTDEYGDIPVGSLSDSQKDNTKSEDN